MGNINGLGPARADPAFHFLLPMGNINDADDNIYVVRKSFLLPMGNINALGDAQKNLIVKLSTPYGKHKRGDSSPPPAIAAAFYSLWET